MVFASVQYWVVFQMVLDLFLVVLILVFIRSYKSGLKKEAARETAGEVIRLIEPLLKEAHATAETFAQQLKEKARLVESINESLDNRIISLNLLLNRAAAVKDGADAAGADSSALHHIYDQQESILALYRDDVSSEDIAKQLGLPRGEVDLVIDLKRKFTAGP